MSHPNLQLPKKKYHATKSQFEKVDGFIISKKLRKKTFD
jgi:hypothetical protein